MKSGEKTTSSPPWTFKKFFSFINGVATFGILLTGIGVFIIGVVLSLFYFDLRRETKRPTDISPITVNTFNAYCIKKDKLIILNSFKNPIKNAQIKDLNGKVICSFKKISSNYEEVCKIKDPGIYLLEAQVKEKKIKKVINCESTDPIRIEDDKKIY